jgi:hypothetical protein
MSTALDLDQVSEDLVVVLVLVSYLLHRRPHQKVDKDCFCRRMVEVGKEGREGYHTVWSGGMDGLINFVYARVYDEGPDEGWKQLVRYLSRA